MFSSITLLIEKLLSRRKISWNSMLPTSWIKKIFWYLYMQSKLMSSQSPTSNAATICLLPVSIVQCWWKCTVMRPYVISICDYVFALPPPPWILRLLNSFGEGGPILLFTTYTILHIYSGVMRFPYLD